MLGRPVVGKLKRFRNNTAVLHRFLGVSIVRREFKSSLVILKDRGSILNAVSTPGPQNNKKTQNTKIQETTKIESIEILSHNLKRRKFITKIISIVDLIKHQQRKLYIEDVRSQDQKAIDEHNANIRIKNLGSEQYNQKGQNIESNKFKSKCPEVFSGELSKWRINQEDIYKMKLEKMNSRREVSLQNKEYLNIPLDDKFFTPTNIDYLIPELNNHLTSVVDLKSFISDPVKSSNNINDSESLTKSELAKNQILLEHYKEQMSINKTLKDLDEKVSNLIRPMSELPTYRETNTNEEELVREQQQLLETQTSTEQEPLDNEPPYNYLAQDNVSLIESIEFDLEKEMRKLQLENENIFKNFNELENKVMVLENEKDPDLSDILSESSLDDGIDLEELMKSISVKPEPVEIYKTEAVEYNEILLEQLENIHNIDYNTDLKMHLKRLEQDKKKDELKQTLYTNIKSLKKETSKLS